MLRDLLDALSILLIIALLVTLALFLTGQLAV